MNRITANKKSTWINPLKTKPPKNPKSHNINNTRAIVPNISLSSKYLILIRSISQYRISRNKTPNITTTSNPPYDLLIR